MRGLWCKQEYACWSGDVCITDGWVCELIWLEGISKHEIETINDTRGEMEIQPREGMWRSRELTCGDVEPKHDKDACCIPIVSNMYSTQVPGARDAIEEQPSQTRGDEVEAIEIIEGCYRGVQVKGK